MNEKITVTYSSTNEKTINEVLQELIKIYSEKIVEITNESNEIIEKTAN